jgi:hypothetical protein
MPTGTEALAAGRSHRPTRTQIAAARALVAISKSLGEPVDPEDARVAALRLDEAPTENGEVRPAEE